MTETFKTSVRVMGTQQVDEFHALCALLGRRPHELAADMVLTCIRGSREDPEIAGPVARLVESARLHQGRDPRTGDAGPQVPDNVIPIRSRR